jgi:meso-butanediol dehydrogenase / (S,S)-butanediol dehydrogenase / diacetyl reductase
MIAPERKALVTGAASGMGLEVSRRLVGEGVAVAMLDVNEGALISAAEQIGGGVAAIPTDVRSASQVRESVDTAIAHLGGLDTLVICAGVIHVKPLAEVTEQDWDETIDINLKGAFLACQAAAPALSSSGRGRIVMISSDAGKRGVPRLHAYSASKFGLVALTESFAAELAPAVTVNSVCPVGVPTTGMGQMLLAWKAEETGRPGGEVLATIARGIPLARHTTTTDVADAVLFFVSESANFITGVALDLDGGARLNFIPGADT